MERKNNIASEDNRELVGVSVLLLRCTTAEQNAGTSVVCIPMCVQWLPRWLEPVWWKIKHIFLS